MRLKPKEAGDVVNNGAPIKVRFPSVREKLKVLQASRNVTRILRERRITILEDFTDQVWKSKKAKQRFSFPPVKVMLNAFQLQVLRHRQALASFARRRARKTKKKWALKYDELYFNGRVFVFDEDSNRVEAAWRTSEQQMSPKANLSKVWEMPFRWKIFTRVNSGQIGEFIGKYQYLISCLYLHSVGKLP